MNTLNDTADERRRREGMTKVALKLSKMYPEAWEGLDPASEMGLEMATSWWKEARARIAGPHPKAPSVFLSEADHDQFVGRALEHGKRVGLFPRTSEDYQRLGQRFRKDMSFGLPGGMGSLSPEAEAMRASFHRTVNHTHDNRGSAK